MHSVLGTQGALVSYLNSAYTKGNVLTCRELIYSEIQTQYQLTGINEGGRLQATGVTDNQLTSFEQELSPDRGSSLFISMFPLSLTQQIKPYISTIKCFKLYL